MFECARVLRGLLYTIMEEFSFLHDTINIAHYAALIELCHSCLCIHLTSVVSSAGRTKQICSGEEINMK